MVDETSAGSKLLNEHQEPSSKSFRLDPIRNQLVLEGRVIPLSPLATRLLELLAREPGAVVKRNAIIDELWQGNYLVGEAALNRLVSEVRHAAGDDARDPRLIQTLPRRGYRLVQIGSAFEGRAPNSGATSPVTRRFILLGAIAAIFILALLILVLIILENLIAFQSLSARS